MWADLHCSWEIAFGHPWAGGAWGPVGQVLSPPRSSGRALQAFRQAPEESASFRVAPLSFAVTLTMTLGEDPFPYPCLTSPPASRHRPPNKSTAAWSCVGPCLWGAQPRTTPLMTHTPLSSASCTHVHSEWDKQRLQIAPHQFGSDLLSSVYKGKGFGFRSIWISWLWPRGWPVFTRCAERRPFSRVGQSVRLEGILVPPTAPGGPRGHSSDRDAAAQPSSS